MTATLRTRWSVVVAIVLLIASSATAQVARVSGVESVGFTVADMDRSIAFYGDVLGCRARPAR